MYLRRRRFYKLFFLLFVLTCFLLVYSKIYLILTAFESVQVISNTELQFKHKWNTRVISYKRIFHERSDLISSNLSDLIQKRFYQTQNPQDCSQRKFIICDLLDCGFGCQMHHLVYCLNEALKQNRTFLLDDTKWKYKHNGFLSYFQPLSETCINVSTSNPVLWHGIVDPSKLQKIYLRQMSRRKQKPNYPSYFLSDQDRIVIRQFHSEPFVWYVAETLKYIMRLQPAFERVMNKTLQDLNTVSPIVGIHVRRTDKIAEADYYPLEAYLKEAENFFQIHQDKYQTEKITEKNIYLATDDMSVITEALTNFTQYNFKFNKNASIDASLNRDSPDSLEGLLQDIYTLAHCDYIVCTLSSNLCRFLYEFIQITHPIDATWRIVSLDANYFFDFFSEQFEQAIYDHVNMNQNELEFRIGDVIQLRYYMPVHLKMGRVRNYLFNGFKNGTNLRTNRTGLYPAYKTIE